jgi:hypothetical protein
MGERKRRGRPIQGKAPLSDRFNIWLEPAMRERIQRAAHADDRSEAYIARRALELGLEVLEKMQQSHKAAALGSRRSKGHASKRTRDFDDRS